MFEFLSANGNICGLSAECFCVRPAWAGSPLYVNPVNVLNTLAKVLAEGKGGIVRFCLKAERSGRLAAGESE
jgi:hypothetical protein